MSLFETVIMSMYDVAAFILISKKISKVQISSKYATKVWILFSVIAGSIGYFIQNGVLSLIFNVVVLSLILKLLFRQNWSRTIMLYVFIFVLFMGIQFSIIWGMNAVYDDFAYNFINGMIAQNIFMFIVVLIYIKMPIEVVYDYIISRDRTFRMIIGGVFIISISTLGYWYIDFDESMKNSVLFFIVSITVVYITFNIMKSGLINKANEKELMLIKTLNPMIEELMDEIRARQHEFDNHIQAMKVIVMDMELEGKKATVLKEYLGDFEIKNEFGDLAKMEDKILAGFLYSKKKKADEMKARIFFEINNYKIDTILKSFELVEIFGILIDNALETGVQNNEIYFKIDKEKDMNVIEVKNRYPYLQKEMRNNIFKKGFSTKSGKGHGYGLHNFKKIIVSAEGTIEISNISYADDNYVSIKSKFN